MPDEYHPEFGEHSLDEFEDTYDEGVEDFFASGPAGGGAWWEDTELWEGEAVGEWDDDEDNLPLEGADFGEEEEFGLPKFPNPFSPEARAKRQAAKASRQAARSTPEARAQRAADAQTALQTAGGLFSMFTPLIQTGMQQAQLDAQAKRDRKRGGRRGGRRRPPRRPLPAPSRPAPQQQMSRPMPMMQRQPPAPPVAAGMGKQQKLMLWIAGGTLATVAVGTGIYFIVRKKK